MNEDCPNKGFEGIQMKSADTADQDNKFVETNNEENNDDAKEKKKTDVFKGLKNLFRSCTSFDYILLCGGLIFGCASGVAQPLFMVFFGDLLDDITKTTPTYTESVIIMAYIALGTFVANSISITFLEIFANRITTRYRRLVFAAVTEQEIGFFDISDPGTISTQLEGALVQIRNALGVKLGQIAMFSAMGIGGFLVSFIKNWKMAFVMLSGTPVLIIVAIYLAYASSKLAKDTAEGYKAAGAIAEETLAAPRTITAFGSEEFMIEKYKSHLYVSQVASLKASTRIALALSCLFGVMFLMYALGFWYGGKLVADSIEGIGPATSLGDVLAVFFGVVIGAFALGQMANSIADLFKGFQGMEELQTIIERESKIPPTNPKGQKPSECRGEIEFRNVKFSFPSRTESYVFSNLNLTIKPGETIALVGESGCGKSTIIELIERFYDPDNGNIYVDGTKLTELNLSWWRSQIGIVGQEPKLFSTTIHDNIEVGLASEKGMKFGETNKKPSKEVIDAANMSGASEFIDTLSAKYFTMVGTSGSHLSGGQKQRIAIARALIRDPKILILDEATSALDSQSERYVQASIDQLLQKSKGRRTTIIIAHRLSTIKNADRIIVLGRQYDEELEAMGSVVKEFGKHTELMSVEDGIYKKLIEAQRLLGTEDADILLPEPVHCDSRRLISHKSSNLSSKTSFNDVIEDVEKDGKDEEKKKKKKDKKDKPVNVSYFRLLNLIRPDIIWFICGLFAAACNGLTFPSIGIIFASSLSALSNPDPTVVREESAFWACMYMVVAAGAFTANFFQVYCLEHAGTKLSTLLREMTYTSMIYQDIGFFDLPTSAPGSLTAILAADTTQVKAIVGSNTGAGLQAMVALFSGVIIAFTASPEFAGVLLACIVVIIPATILQTKFMHGRGDDVKSSVESKTQNQDQIVMNQDNLMHETISGIRIVASFGLEQNMRVVYDDCMAIGSRQANKHAAMFGFLWGFSQGANLGVNAFALWYGGRMVMDGRLDADKMMMTIFAILFGASGSSSASMYAADSAKANLAARNVYAIVDRIPAIDTRNTGGEKPVISGQIKFNEVNFRYPQRPAIPVYKSITFEVEKDTTVALVGSSGCGKSTVVGLLERFYDLNSEVALPCGGATLLDGSTVDSGSITAGGIDIRYINVKYWRENIGLVGQEPVLFNTTLEENIRLGKPDATEEEIWEACRKSNAANFVETFPDKLKTIAGPGGSKLSGGQKQRIAIARAIIRNPKILLLDEATSALDAESEAVVQRALDELISTQKRSTLVIAHKLKTIEKSDKIVVLATDKTNKVAEKGSHVVEQGSHTSLLEANGPYRRLVDLSNVGPMLES